MAKAEKDKGGNAGPVTAGGSQCIYHGCNKKPARAEFCEEHFKWFKVGLITVRGERAKDFDKKMQSAERMLAMFN